MSSIKKIGRISEINQTIDFEWEIDDFISYTEKNLRYFSPKFHALNSMWHIEVWLNDSFPDKLVSISLSRVGNRTPKAVEWVFSIKSVNGTFENKIGNKNFAQTYGLSVEEVGWLQLIAWDRLLNDKENLVPSGTLTIICSIMVKNNQQDFDSRPLKLVEDFKGMFNTKKNSDVILKINEHTISAHRSILAARSSVFAAMFENEMEEKITGIVNIHDCDLETFNVLLLYIYTGTVDFENCNAFNLYRIADKYGVTELMMMCVHFMIRNLSVESICEVFIFGTEFNEKKLLADVQYFFNKNFKEIVFSDTWESFINENTNFANDLLKGMAQK